MKLQVTKLGSARSLLACAISLSIIASRLSAGVNEELLNVFPASSQPTISGGWSFNQTEEVDLSGSTWYAGYNELDVYQAALSHAQAGSASKSWEIRVGKGGQIYSIRSQFGEAIPPQVQSYAPGSAPWNDEVFQSVSVDTTQNTSQQPYFIHQSGYYVNDDVTAPFYSPLLAHGAVGDSSYGTLSWGVQAHDPDSHRSKVLNWQQTRDVGQGIVEVTNVLYNFGDDVLNYHSMPWGGTRSSNLGKMLMSNPGGGFTDANIAPWDNWQNQVLGLHQTGGWAIFSNGTSNSSLGLGIVFGNADPLLSQPWQYAGSSWRWGRGGGTGRDYLVGELRRHVDVGPGDLFFSRYFLVFGTVGEIQQTISQNGLVGDVGYNMLTVTEASATTLPWRVVISGGNVSVQPSAPNQADFMTYAQPVEGAKPLFLLEEAQGNEWISVDPYSLSDKPYDGATQYKGLLGFVLPDELTNTQGTSIPYADLSTIFPVGSEYYLDPESGMQVIAGPVTLGEPGDYSGNGIVDAADYTVWRDTLGSDNDLRADGDHSGTVGESDIVYWRARFGNGTEGNGAAARHTVPEPSSGMAVFLLICAYTNAVERCRVCASRRSLNSK